MLIYLKLSIHKMPIKPIILFFFIKACLLVSNSLLGQIFAQSHPTPDIMLNSPDIECVYAFDGIDNFSGQKRTDLHPQILFTFTPKILRKSLEQNEYIICKGNLTKIEMGLIFLNLEFEIHSKDAREHFGGLPIYSPLNIRLINGENIRLLNKKEDLGKYNSIKEIYNFSGQYSLNKKQINALKKSELDKIRVVWKTGYEDYEIYELDFFFNQIRCIENKF